MAVISQKELAEIRRVVAPGNRFVDLMVQFQMLNDDGTRGELVPRLRGGIWDRTLEQWAPSETEPVNVQVWPIQRQQMSILERLDDQIFFAIFGGRQAGKTDLAIKCTGLDWIDWPAREVCCISQDFKASREAEQAFESLLAPWWKAHQVKTDRYWILPHMGRYLFRSEEAIDSVRGPSLKSLLLNEASLFSYESFLTAVGCGAAAKSFRIFLATTPKREVKWIRNVYEKWAGMQHRGTARLLTYQNPRRNEQVLDAIREDTPRDLYQQEFEGKLVPPQDRIYWLYDGAVHKRQRPHIGNVTRAWAWREWRVRLAEAQRGGTFEPLLAGWDFGKEAVVLGQMFLETYEDAPGSTATREVLWIVGEDVNMRTTTEQQAADIVEHWGRNIAIRHDAMGQHARVGGRGDEPAAQKILEASGFADVRPCARRNPLVADRQRAVQRLLRNAKNEVRLYIEPGRAPHLEDALENQRMGPNGKPILDEHAHVLDALGYLVWAAFPIDSVIPEGYRRAAYADEDSR